MCAALGLSLWHGGYRSPAQIALAAVALAGLAACRGRPALRRDPLWLGLVAVALANAASLAWHPHRGSIGPALAAAAVAVVLAIARTEAAGLRRYLPAIVAAIGLTIATTGLAGLAVRAQPLAERIDGVWRAGGTFEYPPALAAFCACALAYVLALHGQDRLDRSSTLIVGAILAAAVVASFDRAALVETVVVGGVFALRVPPVRRTVGLLVAAAAGCAVLALAVSHPSPAALQRHLRHGAVSSRSGVWQDAWDATWRRPLLGYGPGRFTAIDAASGPHVAQAHDAVLEQAVEAGVVAGAGTAVALLAMLAAGGVAAAARDPERIGHGLAAALVAVSGLYDFTWSFAPIVVLGALAASAAAEGA